MDKKMNINTNLMSKQTSLIIIITILFLINGQWLPAATDASEADTALHQVDKAISLAGDQIESHWWKLLAQLHLQKNEYRQATAALEIFGYLQPLELDELKLLGDLNFTIGTPIKAAEYYARLSRREPRVEYHEKLARAWYAAHRHETALTVLQEAISRQPDAKLWFLMGQILFNQNQYTKAYEAFARAAKLANKPNGQACGKAQMMMAYCAINLEEYERATAVLKKACRCPHTCSRARKLLKQVHHGSVDP